jgi:shikimate dehydrogenase
MRLMSEANKIVNRKSPDADTRLVALLGHPVGHSLSPLIHNTAFRAQGLNFAYAALDVAPDDVADAVAGLRALGFAGANVTIPHKEAVISHLDALTDRAEAIGAVNTLFWDEKERLAGDNTDAAGFLAPLADHAERLRHSEMLIFGAGGAARAAAYGLLTQHAPARLTLAARTPAKAERLAADLAPYDAGDALAVVPFDEAGSAVRAARLLVNATPLGMAPRAGGTSWNQTEDFHEDQFAYDLVYAPPRTRFLRETEAEGATPVGGLGMLVGQAAESYRRWTGREMPTGAVRRALRRALRERLEA